VPSPEADNAVVQVRVVEPLPYGRWDCVGVLVAPNLVLTALHCVTFSQHSGYRCAPDGSLWTPDDGTGWLGAPVPPADVHVHFGTDTGQTEPAAYGQEIFGSGSTEACIDDIALVALDRDLPVTGVPMRLERAMSVGETLSVTGYGNGSARPGPFVRFRRDGVRVLAVGPDTTDPVGLAPPRMFATDYAVCSNDDGAPALVEATGAVAGIYSRGDGGVTCEDPDRRLFFVKVTPYASLVQRAFDAVGARPTAEAEPSAAVSRASQSCTLRGPAPRGSGWLGALLATAAVALCRRRARSRAMADAGGRRVEGPGLGTSTGVHPSASAAPPRPWRRPCMNRR